MCNLSSCGISFLAHTQRFAVSAVIMKPGDFPDQVFRQLDAVRVYFKPARINPAFPRYDIQVPAGDRGEENRALLIFDFLEAAQTALLAEVFPREMTFFVVFHF